MFNKSNTEHLNNSEDKYENLHSFFVFEKNKNELIKDTFELLKKSKNIKNSFKRRKINDALYNFKNYIESKLSDDTICSSMFFFTHNLCEEYKLTKKQKNITNEYKIGKNGYLFFNEDKFKTEYFLTLLDDYEMYTAFKLDRKKITQIKLDKYKYKNIESRSAKSIKDIDEYISEFKDISNSVIFGNSSHIKKINIPKNWIVDYSILSNNEIIKLFNDKLMEKKLLELTDIFTELEFDNNKILYGMLEKEIKTNIENYRVEKLFIHSERMNDFKNCIDTEFVNFKIIEINKLNNGDDGDKLLNDYGGFIGKLYY